VAARFRWIAWNSDHIGRHEISTVDAEYVVNHARSPFPRRIDSERVLVQGQDSTGRYVQVIYIFSPANVVFVIHARSLTEPEKRRLRRRRR
jgi:uncharacterized DUF497 family protein